MEEKQVPESMASVTIKPEYPPSEYCSSEPPPAYHKPQSSAVQVAKIVAVTVVLVSFVLGSFLLASAYVTANASCRQLEQDLELLSEVADRFDGTNQGPLQPEALIQEKEPVSAKRQADSLQKEAATNTKDIDDNSIDNSDSSSDSESSSSSESEEEPKIHLKLPLQLDFDDLAGTLIAQNQRSKMNCIVEKKRAEEVVDHQPKTLRLPFGVNLTTDPRFERLTGERMVIICESGHMQSAQPPQTEKPQVEEDDDDDDDQETIMIQPVMIPIPPTNFQTHMPQRMAPMPIPMQSQGQPQIQIRQLHPMETMRPPMPPVRQAMQPMRPPMEQMRPEIMRMPFRPPVEMRPAMEPERPTIEQIIAFRQNQEAARQNNEYQRAQEMEQSQRPMMMMPQQLHIRFEPQQPQPQPQPQPPQPQQQPEQDNEVSPNPVIQHIIQQIIAQKIMDIRRAQEQEQQMQESRERQFQPPQPANLPERMVPRPMIPIPEEVLTHLNRLPNNERVIVAVSEPDSSEEDSSDESSASQESMPQPSQEQKQQVQEMPSREAYMRRLPVNIPVNMMQEQESSPESENTRPHYVQPRSVSVEEPKSRVVRSANPLVPEKRVKRCACECAC
ncbi:uncharacterized protein LOC143199085 [Rhynchophorus ferrugineus]|uniref:uncharacterized protein LOC143199085 n=1 Tax=Rhynchophorus ferrugineus TaxID=354439 RepID=UPI003FCEB7AF